MTISSTTTQTLTTCNGTTTNFAFGNKIFSASDLVATLIDTAGNLYAFTASGVNTFTNASTGLSYTVYNIDVDAGCFIVFSAAPTNLWQLDLRTAVAELQSTSIKNQAAFYPELHEEFFDRATREIQDLRRLTYTYGIHGPDTESTAWTQLPNAKTRANLLLGFDSNGLPTTATTVSQPLTQSLIGQFLYPQTAAEIAAGVTPTYYFWPPYDSRRYGTVGNGVADDTAAIAKTLLAANGTAPAYFSAGTYLTSSKTVLGSSQIIQGAGQLLTIFTTNSATAGIFSTTGGAGTYEISDVGFTSSVTQTGGALLATYSSVGLIQRVSFNNYSTAYTCQDNVNCIRDAIFTNPNKTTGNGVVYSALAGGGIMERCLFNAPGVSNQPNSGVQVNSCGALNITDCQIIQQGTSLLVNPGSSQQADSIYALNTFFDSANIGINLAPGAGGIITRCRFNGCWSSSAQAVGLAINAGSGTIDGVEFISHHAVACGTNNAELIAGINISFVGGAYSGCTAGSGLSVSANVGKFSIIGGVYGSGYGEAGNTNGITLGGGHTNYTIQGANVSGNSGASIAGTGSSAGIVANNPGYNPVGTSAITYGSSPFTHTAGQTEELVYVYGGTVSAINVNGLALSGVTSGSFKLGPFQSIVVTASAAPSMARSIE